MSSIQTDSYNFGKAYEARVFTGEGQPIRRVPSTNQSSNETSIPEQATVSKESYSDEQIAKKLEKIFKAMQGPDTNVEMSVHKETKAIMIKVFNKETGEMIREVPPEKTLDIVAKFMEINGILVDKKV